MIKAVRKSTTPIATGERLIAAYGCADVIDLGVVDILQPDIAHVGGITALWKVSAAAEAAGIRMAPHACEGPVGGLASLHVDAASPNFLAQEICGLVDAGEMNKVWEDLLGFPAMRMVDGRYPMLTEAGPRLRGQRGRAEALPVPGHAPVPDRVPRRRLGRLDLRASPERLPESSRDAFRETVCRVVTGLWQFLQHFAELLDLFAVERPVAVALGGEGALVVGQRLGGERLAVGVARRPWTLDRGGAAAADAAGARPRAASAPRRRRDRPSRACRTAARSPRRASAPSRCWFWYATMTRVSSGMRAGLRAQVERPHVDQRLLDRNHHQRALDHLASPAGSTA